MPYDYYSMGASCGQCHVIISDPFFDKTNKIPSTEQRTLDRAVEGATNQNSRLACCVNISPALNEMIIIIGTNRSHDGDYFSGKDPAAF